MAGIEFDFSEINALAADLGEVPERLKKNVRKALQVTVTNVKQDWRKAANRTGLAGYAADITYEIKTDADGLTAEVGPTIGDAGSFGLVEDANGGVRSAPQHAARNALKKNEADFIKGLLTASEDIL